MHEPGAEQSGDDIAHGPGHERAGMDDVEAAAKAQPQRLEHSEGAIQGGGRPLRSLVVAERIPTHATCGEHLALFAHRRRVRKVCRLRK